MAPNKALFEILNFEAYLGLAAMILMAWLFYKIFLNGVSLERHLSLQGHLRKLLKHVLVFTAWFALFSALREVDQSWAFKSLNWVASITLLWGIMVFIRVSRLLLLQYLFLGSMQAGVPLLVVNIFSLVLSVLLLLWVATRIFDLNLAPLLATSAAFSIILGLAMQDTLGNLFAGISLQVDRAFEIGDWVEVYHNNLKVVGQVKEISWRSTILVGWSDELITLPNRSMANAQISNYTGAHHPIFRTQDFRFPYGSDLKAIKDILLRSLEEISEISPLPAPMCYVRESTESWVLIRISYGVENFGQQYLVGDQVLSHLLKRLNESGISVAHQVLDVSMGSISQTK